MVTLKQLQCLLAVEEASHFRRAAERLEMTQPSLSAQFQNLEEALGVRLAERSRSGVALTPVGREIALRARRVMDETQGIADFAAGAQSGLVGVIRLGAKPTLGPYLLPHVVAALHRSHKDLRLYVRESEPRHLEDELGRGVHDVILTQLPAASTEHVGEPLFGEPLYLALARDHPLAKEDGISVSALKGLEILTVNPSYHLYDQVASLCETFGAKLVRDYEGTSLDALRLMVGMGMGAAFLPSLYIHSEITARSEVVVKKLKGRAVTRSVGLVWRKSAGRAEAYRQIADIVRTVVQKKFDDLRVV
ncbi:LysR substrate-binding domain-containing protein [Hyphococcus flavus]|uniref:LysR substrate-binding domain-containing protein n=1 Tax=Hyphococcus flavus TaxID=1866326 RepID=A0AAE9ZGB4_9PROT|nr:hydrogen peroxide-inducible genes activator [Hyphococcus flavus]WDI32197.1 LysR substrate-binding domain-containing protein [Hyphococcus flavus]